MQEIEVVDGVGDLIVEDEVEKEVDAFIQSVPVEEQVILRDVVERKKRAKNKRDRDLASIVRDICENDYVKFSDGSGISINELLGARATRNLLMKDDLLPKDLIDLKKVQNDEKESNGGGLNIVFVTHGQDLGE